MYLVCTDLQRQAHLYRVSQKTLGQRCTGRHTWANYLGQCKPRHFWLWVVMRMSKDVVDCLGIHRHHYICLQIRKVHQPPTYVLR